MFKDKAADGDMGFGDAAREPGSESGAAWAQLFQDQIKPIWIKFPKYKKKKYKLISIWE